MARQSSEYGDEEKAKKTMYTIKLDSEKLDKLGFALESRDWEPCEVAYARFAYTGEQVNIVG